MTMPAGFMERLGPTTPTGNAGSTPRDYGLARRLTAPRWPYNSAS
jgi:hypothetical protein